jgi:hypothetical protein
MLIYKKLDNAKLVSVNHLCVRPALRDKVCLMMVFSNWGFIMPGGETMYGA